MTSSAIPARLEFQCGHAALVSLPRIKGESTAQRNERITREKEAAQTRACDFCGPDVAIVVQAAEPEPVVFDVAEPTAEVLADLEAVAEVAALVAEADALEAVIEETVASIEETVVLVAATEDEPIVAVIVEEESPVAVEDEPVVPVAEPEAELVLVVAEEAPVAPAPRRGRKPRSVAVQQALRQYTVRYRVDRVIDASDIGDALRRATELGATDVLAITRA